MSYGVQIVMDNGRTFDTNGFSCNTYDLVSYTTGSGTFTKQYPELVGYNIYAMVQKISNNAYDASAYVNVSYPSGVPTITYGTLVSAITTTGYGGGNSATYIYVVVS